MSTNIVLTAAPLHDAAAMAVFLRAIPNSEELAKVLQARDSVSSRAYDDDTWTARFVASDGQLVKCYTNPPTDPLASGYGATPPGSRGFYSPFFNFVGDVGTGAIDIYSLGIYGTGKLYEGVNGFPVSKVNGWSTLGPSGLAYDNNIGSLYVVDGDCNAVVAIDNTPNLLVKDEITVAKSCKKFTCKDKNATCAKLVKAGSPLNKPEAEAILPNGNLIVANTGTNELVELTPTGTVLDTKTVDTSKTPAIFGLWATGTNDNNTALYYTDANSNTVQEMEQ